MLVSIIIPVYNGSNYLKEAIDSALNQTYSNIEVIVVNDGSDDDGKTERIALSYGKRIHYYKKENGGVASALNLGIEKMNGEYFSWLSHDDEYTKNKIERQMAAIDTFEEKNVIVYSDFTVIDKMSNKLRNEYIPDIKAEYFREWILTESMIHGCTLLIPKLAFDKIGLFREDLQTVQDYELWFRMAEMFKFTKVEGYLVRSRHHDGQATISMPDIVYKECNELRIVFFNTLYPHYKKTEKRKYLNIADRFKALGFIAAYIHVYHFIIKNSKNLVDRVILKWKIKRVERSQ